MWFMYWFYSPFSHYSFSANDLHRLVWLASLIYYFSTKVSKIDHNIISGIFRGELYIDFILHFHVCLFWNDLRRLVSVVWISYYSMQKFIKKTQNTVFGYKKGSKMDDNNFPESSEVNYIFILCSLFMYLSFGMIYAH